MPHEHKEEGKEAPGSNFFSVLFTVFIIMLPIPFFNQYLSDLVGVATNVIYVAGELANTAFNFQIPT